uniref:Uncharacterized protein n=1 Tax=Acrobeloides nanus TaxID=290746 RepID=A0A914E1M3_9BILA
IQFILSNIVKRINAELNAEDLKILEASQKRNKTKNPLKKSCLPGLNEKFLPNKKLI